MTCTIPQERIAQTKAFRGHWCPNLAIGIRAAELALREFPPDQGGRPGMRGGD